MDQHRQQRCKWAGGCLSNAVPGVPYCPNHKRQHFESRPLQLGKNDASRDPLPNPPSVSRDSATTRPENGPRENGSLDSPSASRISLQKNNKKQLPNPGLARKTVKQPANIGQTHTHPVSPIRGVSSESPSTNPRPLKRQRLSGVPNLSGPQPRSNSPSFSENGIPPLSKRGMLRQSEKRTYKLSAIDDFALRPKKKDATTELARSNPSNDRRPPNQNGSRPSSSSQHAPASSQRPQSAGLNDNARPASHAKSSASIVIDLTLDNSERPLSRAKPQLQPHPPPKSFVPNGITGVAHQTPKHLHEINQVRNLVTPDNKQGREGPAQPRGIAQIKHGPSVEQASRDLNVHKPPQSAIPNAPPITTHIAQATRPQTNGASPKMPGTQQRSNAPTRNNDMGPVHDSSDPAKITSNPLPIKQNHPVNGISHPPVEEKTSIPIKGWTAINSVNRSVTKPDNNSVTNQVINSARNDPRTEQSAAKKIAKPAYTPPMPVVIDPLPQEARVMAPVEIRHKEPPKAPPKKLPNEPPIQRIPSIPSKQNVQFTRITSTEPSQPPPPPPPVTTQQGPLTALLGGRKWKKMSPEERRCFWVSQHDPNWFDAQIYSDNNRPFRPGDPLFGLPEDALPPRPTQPATHFSYTDPRPKVTPHHFDSWLKKKQTEIAARGNRKANFGKAAKRAARRKRAAPIPTETQKREALPQRVRDNPNWLASVAVLDQIAAQIREKKNQTQAENQTHSREHTTTATTKTKTKAQPTSTTEAFFACQDRIKQSSPHTNEGRYNQSTNQSRH